MIKESDRLNGQKAAREERINYLKQVIEASARYERLLGLKDFQDLLGDLRKISDVHGKQIDGFVKEKVYADSIFSPNKEESATNFPAKMAWLDSVILNHAIRKDQVDEAINYPARLIHQALSAREELSKLKEEDKTNA